MHKNESPILTNISGFFQGNDRKSVDLFEILSKFDEVWGRFGSTAPALVWEA